MNVHPRSFEKDRNDREPKRMQFDTIYQVRASLAFVYQCGSTSGVLHRENEDVVILS